MSGGEILPLFLADSMGQDINHAGIKFEVCQLFQLSCKKVHDGKRHN